MVLGISVFASGRHCHLVVSLFCWESWHFVVGSLDIFLVGCLGNLPIRRLDNFYFCFVFASGDLATIIRRIVFVGRLAS